MNFFRRSPTKDDNSHDEDSEGSSVYESETDDEVDDKSQEQDAPSNDVPAPVAPTAAAVESTAAPTDNVEEATDNVAEESDEDDTDEDSGDESEVSEKKGGWFGFLRRSNKSESSDEDESEDEESIQEDNEEEPQQQQLKEEKPAVVEAEEEEIAQAIQRVQQRIADYRKKQAGGGGSSGVDGVGEDASGLDAAQDLQGEEVDSAHDVSLETEPSSEPNAEEPSTESSAETIETEESAEDATGTPHSKMTNGGRDMEPPYNKDMNANETPEEVVEDNEPPPSLSERRSLLSLAAEHNRVDVIKELISMKASDEDRKSLLQGVFVEKGATPNDTTEFVFVPPPLHAAVAHGSVDAASCLLRMGADPSLRPFALDDKVLKRSNSGTEQQDGNYKKYYGRTAWELAFGALVKIEDGHELDDDEEVSEEKSSRGWFGFGAKEEKTINVSNEDGVRYRQISGLNIPSAKLEGIKNAFTAEALRAIGSDEVDRLSQLLDAGMTQDIEVAGKTLKKWAAEMNSVGCLALLMQGGLDEDECDDEDEIIDKQEDYVEEEESVGADVDEQLAGLSNQDIAMLIQENESLIPALTACRDDLAEESDMCQNILRDMQATGGKGGLTSHSLLELVRSLKENRQDLDESFKQWQDAWEEREDELDWFWEEAIDDELREKFTRSGLLDEFVEPGVKPISAEMTLRELARRHQDAVNRVSTLRSSIATLAEESARYRDAIDSSGMSGALSLVRSLKNELKELKEKITQAQAGESNCRRKIKIIQREIGHPVNGEEVNDFQLDANDGSAEHEGGETPIKPEESLQSKVISGKVPTPEIFSSQELNSVDIDNGVEHDNTYVEEDAISEGNANDDQSSYEGDYEGVENAVDSVMHSETLKSKDNGEIIQPVEDMESTSSEDPSLDYGHENNISATTETPEPFSMKQSEMRESGMSTAIVVRQPNGNDSSLPFQIWDLLKRIMGLRRSSSVSSGYREYDINSSRHIMIV